jgi:hypothetical protein
MSYLDWATKGASQNYLSAVDKAASKYNVPADLVKGYIQTESSWQPNVYARDSRGNVIATGGAGIAQFVKSTAKGYGIDRMNPYQSIDAITRYFSTEYKKTGSWSKSLEHIKGKRDTSTSGDSTLFQFSDQLDAQNKGVSYENSNPVPTDEFLNSRPIDPVAAENPDTQKTGTSWLDFFKNLDIYTVITLLVGVVGIILGIYQLSITTAPIIRGKIK